MVRLTVTLTNEGNNVSNPLSITAVAGDSHRVLLQIEGPDGVWQLPVPKSRLLHWQNNL